MQKDKNGFTLVSRRPRRTSLRLAQRNAEEETENNDVIEFDEDNSEPDHRFEPDMFLAEIQGQSKRFARTPFFKNFIRTLQPIIQNEKPAEIICYGLGRFTIDRTAKDQLKFLISLRKHLEMSNEHCILFDPAFSLNEKEILVRLEFKLVEKNEECCHQVNGKFKLFYMPHCHKFMFNNLLWANWTNGDIAKVLIVGNSFDVMTSLLAEEKEEVTYSYIHDCIRLKIVRETMIKSDYSNLYGFNDMSIHEFTPQNAPSLEYTNVYKDKQPKYNLPSF